MEGEDRTRPAGGFATQRGINYQNRIAAFFAVSCLSESIAVPGSPRSPVQSIRCETGEPLADILLSFESGGVAFVEVKRTVQLTATRMKPVVSQLIQQYIVSEQGTNGSKFPWRREFDPTQDRMMLLTSSESPENVTKHLAACLSRIGPEAGPEILATVALNNQEARAFRDFHALSLRAWKELMGVEPPLEKVVRLYSLFRIGTLDVNPDEADEQRASNTLANSILSNPQEGMKAWSSLVQVMGGASESRRSLSHQDLRRAMLEAGFELVSSPSYLPDIRSLREYTRITLDSLDHLATLAVHGRPVRIQRAVTEYLRPQAMKHSLVVVGEPGAGKSGVLHELGSALRNDNQDVVFLAADRLDGALKSELDLKHDLVDVLENWSGKSNGLLIIDALDAARGSKAITVLRDLIRRVVRTGGTRWRVVASIRAFDLRFSQELQSIFRRPIDEAAPEYFQDSSFFPDLRHIKVPRFSQLELKNIRAQAPELDAVFKSATPVLHELLEIPFNLRLVAEMLSSDLSNSELTAIETQVGLLGQYWLSRVEKSRGERPARELILVDVLRVLVAERRLTVSKLQLRVAAATPEFSSLCSDNVLVEQIANLHGRNIIGFSHHLLFDYAASRLLLSADFDRFLSSLASERDLSLFLRPSIDLLFKEAWLKDRGEFWQLLRSVSIREKVPAIAKIIAPAVIPELAKNEQDLAPLIDALESASVKEVNLAEQWIVHVIGAVLAGIPDLRLSLWSQFCRRLASSKCSLYVAATCQLLVDHIVERVNKGEANSPQGALDLSHAAVLFLDRFLEMEPRDGWLVGRAISSVMDLFWVNPEESGRAVRKLITPDEIRNKGAEQGHWISRKVSALFEIDPQLVTEIYIAFFSYEEESQEQTSMSGSRILALTSNRRQDYHQTYWQLAHVFPNFLERNFDRCAELVLAALNTYIERKHKVGDAQQITYLIGDQDHTVLADYSAIWDGSAVHDDVLNIADTYFRKLEESSKFPDSAPDAVDTILRLLGEAKYAYVLRKILKVAKTSGSAMMKAVYPLLISESALLSYDLSSVIGDVLSVGYQALDQNQRKEVETAIYRLPLGATGDIAKWKSINRDRLLGCLPKELLVLPESIGRLDELTLSGGAPENRPPYVSHGVQASPYSELDRMREQGVPVDDESNARLREAAEKLWNFASRFSNTIPNVGDVESIVPGLTAVNEALVSNDPNVHFAVRNSAEANLIAACAVVAKCKELDCSGSLGHTIKSILFSGLNSPVPEHHPESDAQFDRSPAWGSPLQRIDAAAGIGALLANRKCLDPEVMEKTRRVLDDPEPAVRFQVITRLLPLYETDLASLWSILRDIARSEKSTGVLAGALYVVIGPLSGRYKDEVVELLKTILSRTDLPNEGGDATEWAYRIATGLYLWHCDASAYALIQPIIEGVTFLPRRSAHCLMDIREALTFSSDPPQVRDAAVRKRSFGLVETVTRSTSVQMDKLLLGVPTKDRTEEWQKDFQELARLIDYIGNQLYFSSGAYDGTTSSKALDDDARRVFWEESRDAITLLSSVAIPSVAHHLIEMLQSFVPFAPADVFHAISNVVNSAKGWGYQYESMAVGLLVTTIERYLAEYRTLLQQDLRCREELIDILETFVSAGWPSARRLSYRLEEIFR